MPTLTPGQFTYWQGNRRWRRSSRPLAKNQIFRVRDAFVSFFARFWIVYTTPSDLSRRNVPESEAGAAAAEKDVKYVGTASWAASCCTRTAGTQERICRGQPRHSDCHVSSGCLVIQITKDRLCEVNGLMMYFSDFNKPSSGPSLA